jgi:hypothetical protein
MGYKDYINKTWEKSTYSKTQSDEFGEVFTPKNLIENMLGQDGDLSIDWTNPDLKLLDYCAGNANFTSVYIENLMTGLEKIIPDVEARYKHVIENMIYIIEYQQDNANFIHDNYNPNGDFKMNIYVGDGTLVPEDYWDLSYDERRQKYPQHQFDRDIPEDQIRHGQPDNGKKKTKALF